MKRKNVNKLLATVMTVSMAAGVVGCGSQPTTTTPADTKAAEDSKTEVKGDTPATETAPATTEAQAVADDDWKNNPLKDANGNVYDLGGMDIQIVDWWSDGTTPEPNNAYEEARQEYRDWIQETYNFKIREEKITSDWGAIPQQFVDYASAADDGQNLIFVLRSDPSLINAMSSGLMKDLKTIDCLDFSDKKWQGGVHELFSKGGSIYACYAATPEPRCGVYFHKDILKDAGIDPNEIYELQAKGEWTFDKCEEMMEKVQKKDNAGNITVAGTTNNNGNLYKAAIFSNGGSLVSMDSDGKYVLNITDEKTLEGLNWANKILANYGLVQPEGANWDAYIASFQNGEACFCFDDAYQAGGNFGQDKISDLGFACFPKGPSATDYTNVWSNNPVVIPGNYDDDKAWKLAFAYNLYTNPIPGFEDYEGWKSQYYNNFQDLESVDETLATMVDKGCVNLADVIANLDQGSEFFWKLSPTGDTPAAVVDGTKDVWQKYIDDANAK